MGGFKYALVGTFDTMWIWINPSTGVVNGAAWDGWAGLSLISYGRMIAAGGKTMYYNRPVRGTGRSGQCTSGKCCEIAKIIDRAYHGWALVGDILTYSECFARPAVSTDGTRVFAGVSTTVRMFNTSTMVSVAVKTITNSVHIRALAVIGTNLFVLGETDAASVSVDSVTVTAPTRTMAGAQWAYIIRFATTSTGFTANLGTWISTGEASLFAPSLAPAYNVSGYPQALIMSLEMGGSALKVGTGYTSATLAGVPNQGSGFGYTVSYMRDICASSTERSDLFF